MLNKLIISFKKISNKLILFKELVYISEYQQKQIIEIYHDDSLEEHYKIYKMIKAIFWSYYFSHMQRKIIDYVSKCNLCHKIKLSRHEPYKEIKITSVLN